MRVIFFALAYLVSTTLGAQEDCPDDKPINSCIEAVIREAGTPVARADVASAAAAAATSEVNAESAEAVDSSQPGADTGDGNVTSNVTDLIPLLDMLGVLSDSDATDGTIAVDLNFLLGKSRDDADNNTQLKWLIGVSPEPFTPLVEAFPEDIRDARKADLQERIDDTGDTELQLTWSLVTDGMGRDLRRHEPKISALVFPVVSKALQANSNAARVKYLALFNNVALPVIQKHRSDLVQLTDVTFDDLGLPADDKQALKSQLMEAATKIAAEHRTTAAALSEGLIKYDLNRLPDLVLKQPQLLFSANKTFRDELVGPESWGAKITYEHTFANFGHFLRRNSRSCPFTSLDAGSRALRLAGPEGACYAALSRYLEDHEDDLANENRYSVSVEYRQVDSLALAFPQDDVTFDMPKTDRLIVSAGYGRVLPGTNAKDRVDFTADYDSNIDDEASGKSRFVVSLTYTRRVGEFDVPFAIVYANKSEFLEGVDKQLSLHVGVKFKANSGR